MKLREATRDNSAFIMVLDGRTVVEFAKHGNATYVYPGAGPSEFLAAASVSVTELKNKRKARTLLHKGDWEREFDAELFAILPKRASVAENFDAAFAPWTPPVPERMVSSPSRGWPEAPPMLPQRSPPSSEVAHSSTSVPGPDGISYSRPLVAGSVHKESLAELARRCGLQIVDRRPEGGHLTVRCDGTWKPFVVRALLSMGFVWSERKLMFYIGPEESP